MILTIVLLLIGASAFVFYPFIVRDSDEGSGAGDGSESIAVMRQQANVDLFKEQQAQFQQQLDRAEIDEAEYQRLITDAQQLLLRNTEAESGLADRVNKQGLWLVPVLLLLVASTTFFTYQKIGAEDDENIKLLMNLAAEQTTEQQAADWNAELIAAIAERVQQRPDNIYYWAMLAQSSIAKGDILAASKYFASAIEVEPGDSFLLAQYSEALFLVDGSRFTDRVITALDQAFAADSNNQTVLGLKGIQAFENREFKLAITYWEGARRGMDPTSPTWQALQSGIERVNLVIAALADLDNPLIDDKDAQQASSAEAVTTVKIAISISPDVPFSQDQLVFVAAVRETGPPMPLAARKLRAGDLPISITLSDKDALMAGQNLSSVSRIRLVARLSASGSATPQSGDWEAVSDGFDLTTSQQSKTLNINRQRP